MQKQLELFPKETFENSSRGMVELKKIIEPIFAVGRYKKNGDAIKHLNMNLRLTWNKEKSGRQNRKEKHLKHET